MASERIKEARGWGNFILALLTAIGLPTFGIYVRLQRAEIREENSNRYVSMEAWRADKANLQAENLRLQAQITEVNTKLDRIQISIVRLTDATKLKDQP